jgi:hypothetical protein
MRALSVGFSSSRAKLAIREISEDVSDMVEIEVKPGVNQGESKRNQHCVLHLYEGDRVLSRL